MSLRPHLSLLSFLPPIALKASLCNNYPDTPTTGSEEEEEVDAGEATPLPAPGRASKPPNPVRNGPQIILI